jgi:GNAT superfamily N-acetyltransferase
MYFPMLDMDMLCLIEDWNLPNHDVIGVGISITNMTRALQKCRKGRLWPFGWWHCMRALKFHKAECLDLMLIGVLPEYQQKGVNALLFYDLIPWYQKFGFKWGETNVEMETNEKVQSQWQYLEHYQHKRRRCFKKEL